MVHFSNRRSKRAESRRVDIMRAAAAVFRAHGFNAAGMRDIAVAADLSPGNLYHYFRGKEELLYFCQDRSLDRLLDALAAARPAGPKDRRPLAARLRAFRTAVRKLNHGSIVTEPQICRASWHKEVVCWRSSR